MKIQSRIKPSGSLKPYLIIAVAALFAYLPVSSMLFSLKNDVVAIEYPIQHYMSECLHNGEFPIWFNTWGMGFPLQSILSWGVYSTPRMIIALIFDSSIYTLHAEFLFFIIASGCCMFKLLKTHFIRDQNFSLLLACCFMLSGFTVGSSQWLLYITGMTFIPLVLYCLLSLLKKPTAKYVLLFAISYYLLFTNVHVYLTVSSTYFIAIFLLFYFAKLVFLKNTCPYEKLKLIKFTALAIISALLLCAAPIYYSLELIPFLERNLPLASNKPFTHSNYLHPGALSSLLLPLSAIKTTYANTEGTVLDTYIGLLPLLLLPATVMINVKQKQYFSVILLFIALLFLIISFGQLTPLRGWLNVLPGMSYFRHPGVLRVFFNLTILLYIASSFKNYRLSGILKSDSTYRKSILVTLWLLAIYFFLSLAFRLSSLPEIYQGSIYKTIKNINHNELILLNSAIQLFFTSFLLFSVYNRQKLFAFFIITELITNTLICAPFFTIGTYSVSEVNKILHSPEGFPLQQTSPYNTPSTIIDNRNNGWFNINTFRKVISNNISLPGPLMLEKVSLFLENESLNKVLIAKPIVFINDTMVHSLDSIHILEQHPAKVKMNLSLSSSKEIVLQQADFPGWKAYYNGNKIPLTKNNMPFVSTVVPSGKGTLLFKFEKNGVVFSAILLHLFVLVSLSLYIIRKSGLNRLPFHSPTDRIIH